MGIFRAYFFNLQLPRSIKVLPSITKVDNVACVSVIVGVQSTAKSRIFWYQTIIKGRSTIIQHNNTRFSNVHTIHIKNYMRRNITYNRDQLHGNLVRRSRRPTTTLETQRHWQQMKHEWMNQGIYISIHQGHLNSFWALSEPDASLLQLLFVHLCLKEIFNGEFSHRKAHRIVKYLKLKRMNLSIEHMELMLAWIKFSIEALLREHVKVMNSNRI